MRRIKRILFCIIALTLLTTKNYDAQAQNINNSQTEVKEPSTLKDILDQLNQKSFPKASIGIEDIEKFSNGNTAKGFTLFKGFKLVQADDCTLVLRNEGKLNNQDRPYLFEATIPLADLKSGAGEVFKNRLDMNPRFLEAYGTWMVKFRSQGGKRRIKLEDKVPNAFYTYGSALIFGFDEREDAKRFANDLPRAIQLCGGK